MSDSTMTTSTTTTAAPILSPQEIARRFETAKEELLASLTRYEGRTAAYIEAVERFTTERIAESEAAVNRRIATLEALSFGTLLRLLMRKVLGR